MRKIRFKVIIFLCVITSLFSACSASPPTENYVSNSNDEKGKIVQEVPETDTSTDTSNDTSTDTSTDTEKNETNDSSTSDLGGVWTGVHKK